jgi:hypothetical protein
LRQSTWASGIDPLLTCKTFLHYTLYNIRKEPVLDCGATVHQEARAGIWHHDTKKKPLRKGNKKIARDYGNVNWQGIRPKDVEAIWRSSISP